MQIDLNVWRHSCAILLRDLINIDARGLYPGLRELGSHTTDDLLATYETPRARDNPAIKCFTIVSCNINKLLSKKPIEPHVPLQAD